MNEHKKLELGIGPGGIRCPCCTWVPGGTMKKIKSFFNRKIRRKFKSLTKKELNEI